MTEMEAFARGTDPATSWEAAQTVKVKPSQQAVLWVFQNGGGLNDWEAEMTLEEVVLAVEKATPWMRWPQFSESRIRTAVSELMQFDPPMLVDTGKRKKSKRGRSARLIGLPEKKTLF